MLVRHVLCITVGALLVSSGAAAAQRDGPARDLGGFWSASSLTTLERSPRFQDLVIPEAQAVDLETHPPKGPPPISDPFVKEARAREVAVGTPTTEWPDEHRKYGRVAGQARSSWIVSPSDGKLPYRPEGRRLAEAARERAWRSFDAAEVRNLDERCLLGTGDLIGPPLMSFQYNANFQIVQTKDAVVIVSEMNHDTRIIRIGAKHLPARLTPWMGDSVGRWEGDTLVVETTNFRAAEALRPSVMTLLYISPKAKITERFTRVSPTEILYRYEVDDPDIYRETWRGEMPLTATTKPIYEYACHEGNYSLADILAGARQEEKSGAPQP